VSYGDTHKAHGAEGEGGSMNDTQIDRDNSKRLAEFVEKQLPNKQGENKERQLRPQLLAAARNERLSRYELGRLASPVFQLS
jgi:hypothetical protein